MDIFHHQLYEFHQLIFILKKVNEKLNLMRNLLSPKLISGEIDVSNLNIKIKDN